MEESFGIGSPAKFMSFCLQPLPIVLVVVELPVVSDPARSILVRHRLSPGRGEIHDGKTPMAKSKIAVNVKAFRVGTAMRQRPGHSREQTAIDGAIGFGVVKDSCDAAHVYDS